MAKEPPPLHANTKKNIFFSEIATKKKRRKQWAATIDEKLVGKRLVLSEKCGRVVFFKKKRLNTLLIYFDFFWSVSFIIHRIFFCYRALSGIAGPFFLFLNKFFGKNFRNEPLTAFIDSLDARKRKKKDDEPRSDDFFFFFINFCFFDPIELRFLVLFFFKLDAGKEGSVRPR